MFEGITMNINMMEGNYNSFLANTFLGNHKEPLDGLVGNDPYIAPMEKMLTAHDIKGIRKNTYQTAFHIYHQLLILKSLSDLSQFKGVLLGLRQVLATESSLKMPKKAFCSTLKAFFLLKIFRFLS